MLILLNLITIVHVNNHLYLDIIREGLYRRSIYTKELRMFLFSPRKRIVN
jgi:hypothetical protein